MKLRMYLTSLIVPVVLTSVTAQPASAASEDGSFASRGLGARSCSEVLSLVQGPDQEIVAAQLAAWVAGYVSHANRATPGVFDVMAIQDTTAIATLVTRVCEQNPDALVEPAMASLVAMMSAGSQTTGSEISTITVGELTTNVSQETLRMVQQELIELSLLNATSADGAFGPQTQSAIESFQTANNLAETGLPDPLTLFVLFSGE